MEQSQYGQRQEQIPDVGGGGFLEMLLRSSAARFITDDEQVDAQVDGQVDEVEKQIDKQRFEPLGESEKRTEVDKLAEPESDDDDDFVIRKSPAVATTSDELLQRATKFYAIGMTHLDQQENFSAMLNLAMAACTLIDYRSMASRSQPEGPMDQNAFGESVSVRLDMCEYNPKASSSSRLNKSCTLNSAIKMIVSRIEVLKTTVVEIRSGLVGSAAVHGSADGSNEAVAIDESIVVQWEPKECRRNCFARIIGQTHVKQQIKDSFISPLLYPNMFGSASKGLLMYGPPGTGKTTIARAIAAEIMHDSKNSVRVVFLTPQGQDLKSKYHGEGERKIKAIFDLANKLACEQQAAADDEMSEFGTRKKIRALAIIFIDEVDSIASSRTNSDSDSAADKNTVNALLQQMDGFKSHKNVAVIAATNDPTKLDTAILRRLETSVFVDLPGVKEIEEQLGLLVSQLVTDVVTKKDLDSGCSSQSNAAVAHKAAASSCSSSDYAACVTTGDREAWVRYRDIYFQGLTKTPNVFAAAANILAGKKYSAADVNIYFRSVIRENAKRAIKSGIFITGPKIKTEDQESERAYVSVAGMISDQPWTPIKPLVDRVKDFEDSSDPEVGLIVNIPPETTTAIEYIELQGHKYRNIFAKNVESDDRAEFVQLAFIPWCVDPIVSDIFVQVQDDDDSRQVTDPVQAGVIFRIALPMQQGPLRTSVQEYDCTIDGVSYEATGADQIGLIQQIIQDRASRNVAAAVVEGLAPPTDILGDIDLSKFYCVNRRDAAHLFVLTNVKELQDMLQKQAGILRSTLSGLASLATLPFRAFAGAWNYLTTVQETLTDADKKAIEDERKREQTKKDMDQYTEYFKKIDRNSGAKLIDELLSRAEYTNLYTNIGGLQLYKVRTTGSTNDDDIIGGGAAPDNIDASLKEYHRKTEPENGKNIDTYNHTTNSLADYIRGAAAYHTIITAAPMYSEHGHPLYLPLTSGHSLEFTKVNGSLKLQTLLVTETSKQIDAMQYDLAENLRFVNWGLWSDIFVSVANSVGVSLSYDDKEYKSIQNYRKSK